MEDVVVAGLVYLEVHIPEEASLTHPEPGRELFVPALPVRQGGALNVASVLAALGTPVRLATPVPSGPSGRLLRAVTEDLDLPLIPLPATRDGSVSVVIHQRGDRAFLSSADFAALEQVAELPAADWVHVPGLAEARALWPALSLARRRGSKLSLNLSWDPLGLERLRGPAPLACDLVVMNEVEAEALAGGPRPAIERLSPQTERVVVTLGAGGAIGRFHGRDLEVPAREVQVVDPTGAGDAFCAGLLSALSRGLSAELAMSWGHQAAAHVLNLYGGVVDQALHFESETPS